ncbi:MAG: hypothetical protein HY291_17810 [Planctomycetes bacterium]|nr:hypothetical protein [Planctomycetota bacterium]
MKTYFDWRAAGFLAGLLALLTYSAQGEDKHKDPPAISVPAVGSRITVELVDHSQITGKLVSQQNGQLHIFSGEKLLVIALTDVRKLTALEPSSEKDHPAKLASAPVDPPMPQAGAAAQPAKEEEDIEAPGQPANKPADPEKAVLGKLGLGQAKNNTKPEAVAEKDPRPAHLAKDEKEDQELLKLLEQSVGFMDLGKYAAASQGLRRLVRSGDQPLIEKADATMRLKFHRSLAEVLTLCYMQERCDACKGTGLVACPDCGGQGYITRVIARTPNDRVDPGTHKIERTATGIVDNEGQKVFTRDQLCPKCHGHGFDPCETCRGTRNKYPEPTPFERGVFADHLTALANQLLQQKESSYGDTSRTPPPVYDTRDEARLKPMLQQVWIRDSANQVKSDILRLWRAYQYYDWALKADPSIVFRSTEKDYPQEMTKIMGRLRLLYGEFSERQQVYMSNRAESRLDELNYYENFGKRDGQNLTGLEKFKEILTDQ